VNKFPSVRLPLHSEKRRAEYADSECESNSFKNPLPSYKFDCLCTLSDVLSAHIYYTAASCAPYTLILAADSVQHVTCIKNVYCD
jgi:hypothetical protein